MRTAKEHGQNRGELSDKGHRNRNPVIYLLTVAASTTVYRGHIEPTWQCNFLRWTLPFTWHTVAAPHRMPDSLYWLALRFQI